MNKKYILGINGGIRPGYQDTSAVLLYGGDVIAAVEEERLNRIKYSPGQLPLESVKEVLSIAGISIHDISTVAFHGVTWGPAIMDVLQAHFHYYFGYCPPIKRFHHHECHAASAFYASGFDRALIITADGSGDGISTRISVGENQTIRTIKEFPRPQSLGLFYSAITQICGFKRDAGEYKLMGLAALGDKNAYDLNWLINATDEGYWLDTQYLVEILQGMPSPTRHEMLFNSNLLERLNISRRIGPDFGDSHKNLAASAQYQLEKIITHLVTIYSKQTGIKKVCIAGGVALNCVANKKIMQLDEVEDLFVQPASSDAGISLGAAYLASVENGDTPTPISHVYWGRAFSDSSTLSVLKQCGIEYSRCDSLVDEAAHELAHNKVIGWFQGAMEFGPRALGNRSILANPAGNEMKKLINEKVKLRESFRPFGASILQEDFKTLFNTSCHHSPFMTNVFETREEFRLQLQEVTHADGTCRIQTVNENQNRIFYSLLKAFKQQTGLGILLNTSFNLDTEPIVNSPRQAIASFFSSGLDVLFIGNYCIRKK